MSFSDTSAVYDDGVDSDRTVRAGLSSWETVAQLWSQVGRPRRYDRPNAEKASQTTLILVVEHRDNACVRRWTTDSAVMLCLRLIHDSARAL